MPCDKSIINSTHLICICKSEPPSIVYPVTRNMTRDIAYPLVPIANFLACILVLLSLSKSMFQSWNVGVCSFAIWIVLSSFMTAVDSIIWAGSVESLAPVWCDIGTCLTPIPKIYNLFSRHQLHTFR